MKGPNGVFDDEQQLINSSPSTSASASQQNSESERQQFNEHVEVHLDMEPEMITSQTESLSFNRQTGELHSNGVINKMVDEEEEIRELESNEHLNDDFQIDNLKLFENLEHTFSTTTVQEPSHKNCLYSTSIPSCSSNLNQEYNEASRWIPNFEENSFVKCTGYQLSPPMANPVDMAVDDEFLAIADYDNGVHFIDNKLCARRHFNTHPYRICGVQFWHDDRDTRHIIMLCYVTEEKWTINVHSWPDFNEELVFDCPTQPVVPVWARRKITLVDGILYLLATSEQCSAIWTFQMSASVWKTLIVERGRSPSNIGFSFANSLLVGGTASNKNSGGNSVYSDFDVQRWSKAECRIVLCEAAKSQLNILVLFEPNQLVDKQTIKVKRRKNEKWIVQGPKLAVWDSERDIIVYDASGKVFWFDGTNYRIRKIVGDIGRSEVCALEAKNGWCYVLCRHQLCVHAFLYRPSNNQ